MESQFIEKYKSYSNFELLKITQKPDDYQEKAVDAANEILKDRGISEDDLREIEDYYFKEKQSEKENLEENIFDFLHTDYEPKEFHKPENWLNVFLLVVLFQYLFFFYNAIKYLSFALYHKTIRLNIISLELTFFLFFTPILFYLIFKKHKLGWIILFLKNIFNLFLLSPLFFQFLKTGNIPNNFSPIRIFFSLYYLIFALFLLKPSISNLFEISPILKKTIVAITIAITLVYLIVSNTI